MRVDLPVPTAGQLHAAICDAWGHATGAPSKILGVVRDARNGAAVPRATVQVAWLELTLCRGHVRSRRPQLVATTSENGWSALCNVPRKGTLLLSAARGSDSTDALEVQLSADGVLRLDMYVGSARPVADVDPVAQADSTATWRRLRVGDGTVSGVVVSEDGRRPLPYASARIADGPMVRADAHGACTIAGAPTGTRMLEVRAVGFQPVRRPVDVVSGAEPIQVALPMARTLLDTVRVRAARMADPQRGGFEVRRRVLTGTFLTEDDIAPRGALVASNLLRQMRAIRVGYAFDTLATEMSPVTRATDLHTNDRRLLMRGLTGTWCAPAISFDGACVPEYDAESLDGSVRVERIAGIKRYTEISVPPEYQRPRSGRGAISIWPK